MSAIRTPIKTPCIKVCIVDHKAQACLGCRRTIMEIAGWTSYTDQERARIMAELPRRVEARRGGAKAPAS